MDSPAPCERCQAYRNQIQALEAELAAYRRRPPRPWLLVLLILVAPAALSRIAYIAADALDSQVSMFALYGLSAGLLWSQMLLVAAIALLHAGPVLIRIAGFLGSAAFAMAWGWLVANPFAVQDTDVAIVGNASPLVLPLLVLPLLLCVVRYRWVLAAASGGVAPRPISIKTLLSGVALVALYLAALRATTNPLATALPTDDWTVYAVLFSPVALGTGIITALMVPEALHYRGLPRRWVRWLTGIGAAIVSSAASLAMFVYWCSPNSHVETAQYAAMPLAMLSSCWIVSLAYGGLLRRNNYRLTGVDSDFAPGWRLLNNLPATH